MPPLRDTPTGDLTGMHLARGEQREGAMTDVFELLATGTARGGQLARIPPFEGSPPGPS